MSTLEVDADPKQAVRAIVAEARRAVEADRAEVICLGCAGMAGLEEAITTELGVPVIDGIGAAVRLAEAVVGLGLKTSKISTYAPPDDKKITGWPLWQALGVPCAPSRSDTARAALRSRGTMTGTGERHDLIQRPRPSGPAGSGPVAPEADLASRWLGSSVVAASDESFGDRRPADAGCPSVRARSLR